MGIGRVEPSEKGNFHGHSAIFALAAEIARVHDCDVYFEIMHGNTEAENAVRKGKLPVIDTQSWISVQKMNKLSVAPTWGSHL